MQRADTRPLDAPDFGPPARKWADSRLQAIEDREQMQRRRNRVSSSGAPTGGCPWEFAALCPMMHVRSISDNGSFESNEGVKRRKRSRQNLAASSRGNRSNIPPSPFAPYAHAPLSVPFPAIFPRRPSILTPPQQSSFASPFASPPSCLPLPPGARRSPPGLLASLALRDNKNSSSSNTNTNNIANKHIRNPFSFSNASAAPPDFGMPLKGGMTMICLPASEALAGSSSAFAAAPTTNTAAAAAAAPPCRNTKAVMPCLLETQATEVYEAAVQPPSMFTGMPKDPFGSVPCVYDDFSPCCGLETMMPFPDCGAPLNEAPTVEMSMCKENDNANPCCYDDFSPSSQFDMPFLYSPEPSSSAMQSMFGGFAISRPDSDRMGQGVDQMMHSEAMSTCCTLPLQAFVRPHRRTAPGCF